MIIIIIIIITLFYACDYRNYSQANNFTGEFLNYFSKLLTENKNVAGYEMGCNTER